MRPEPLRPGDLVALVSPAGPVRPEQAEGAARVLRGWGLRTRLGPHALGRRDFLAGTDDERLADLNDALRDPEVRGVICLRGGYGTQRIADRLDFEAVRADPKLLMGFSDITALHAALWCETGLATVHGPTGASLPDSAEAARRALMTSEPITLTGEKPTGAAPAVERGLAVASAERGVAVAGAERGVAVAGTERGVAVSGTLLGRAVSGVLLGGNLTMLASNVGTPHQLDLRGAILLLEETGEAPYRVDRMLVQLERSGSLDGLAGIVLGRFLPREPHEVIAEHVERLGVPVLHGLKIGHDGPQAAVGLGVPAHLDPEAGTLTVQSACSPADPGRRSSATAAPPPAAGR
ncbi:putative muramoyltetrapeptide carboxypeptidase [Actinoplanes missouriensis 431]|uniref:Putative muramoyltetrapeptide carboxypeptidase n=1 Tax=Actinoplanes missouriensis (strain ATCC 14538 / DSM 43046 / CBS 188.64 / JCM 3121 / NBRC 102363 / NCIMB 12654 / NRRL B-3342 / UNCC 431) TaxID=512565 RepID=I0H6F0_ACTM4|nr:LD-carboxypeptidase [Actinoplanes missouriensis]BAL88587.1 putative muramoyltetrapeptide carboxypeptidase [Actinoplanes missouriensis 431]